MYPVSSYHLLVLLGLSSLAAAGTCKWASDGAIVCTGNNTFSTCNRGVSSKTESPCPTGLVCCDGPMGYTHSCVKPEDATCAVPPMGSCQNVPLDAVICNTNTTYYPCFRHAVSPILQNCPDKHECKPEPGMPYSLGCIGPKEISTAATIGISFATVAFIVGVGALIIIAWRCQFAITWIKKRAKREDRGVAGVEDESSGAIRLLDFMIVKED